MDKVLDFSVPLDISLLDNVVRCMNFGQEPLRSQADRILTAFREHPDAWQRTDKIIEGDTCLESKFFALQILENVIRFRWRSLPSDKREVLKTYLGQKIIALASDEAVLASQGVFIRKMDLLLVYVLKHDWPRNWPNFIPELVGMSMKSEVLCENNMYILKLLGEELFDFSKESMTASRADMLRGALGAQFQQIFELTEYILRNSTRRTLVSGTLQMLQRFVSRIPDQYLFDSPLLPMLSSKFLPVPDFRVDTMLVLTEVGSLHRPAYNPVFEALYTAVMEQLVRLVPPHVAVEDVFARPGGDGLFLRHLALFLTGFFKAHLGLVEAPHLLSLLQAGMDYLVKVSDLDDGEILKICLEYWCHLAYDLHAMEVMALGGGGGGGGGPGSAAAAAAAALLLPGLEGEEGSTSTGGFAAAAGGGGGGGVYFLGGAGGAPTPTLSPQAAAARKSIHTDTLSKVREIMIKHMAKPEEIIIEVDESGEVVREQTKDTDVLAQYKVMKDTLVYLTHLDPGDTQRLMMEKLATEVGRLCSSGGGGGGGSWEGGGGGSHSASASSSSSSSRLSWDVLNKLCWAIGSISMTLTKNDEKTFLVTVIRDLLGMTEAVKGKNNKAVVASNIMYVVGQYPRFLKEHWKFLKTVVVKLFEFMHESHPGVQDMALDTFLKIATKCRKKFVVVQAGESAMFVETLCLDLPTIIPDLEAHQVHTFYEATGAMIAAHPDPGVRYSLTDSLMRLPNDMWKGLMAKAAEDIASLSSPDTLKAIQRILRTNVCACRTLGPSFDRQLGTLYLDALNVYKVLSGTIVGAVAAQGENILHAVHIKGARVVKREILSLVGTFVNLCEDVHFVAGNFVPPLLPTVLGDYGGGVGGAREPEVLNLMADLVIKLKGEIGEDTPGILAAVFEPTLAMITLNFSDYPEHRTGFFKLLGAITTHAFPSLFRLSQPHQKLVVDSIVWAIKHEARDIGEQGLDILEHLLRSMVSVASPDVAQPWFFAYLLPLLQELFAVLTDRAHKAHLKQHALIMQLVLGLIKGGAIQMPLWDCPLAVSSGVAAQFQATVQASPPPQGALNNAFFLDFFLKCLVSSAFKNLHQVQVKAFVDGLFDMTKDAKMYKSHLRDFLVTIMELTGEEGAQELYAEEVALERARAEQVEASRRAAIPGLLNPYSAQLNDDDPF